MTHASRRRPLVKGLICSSIAAALGVGGLVLFTSPAATASPEPGDYWSSSTAKPGANREGDAPRVNPSDYAAFTLDGSALRGELRDAPLEQSTAAAETVWVPSPDGDLVAFAVKESPVMEAELAAEHPELRTYAGRGVEDPTATIRFDVTPNGFHAAVRGAADEAAWYVDPAWNGDDSLYLSYLGSSLPVPEKGLVEPELDEDVVEQLDEERAGEPAGDEVSLRTYRLALVTDPSYAAYFGTENVLAEKVTLMNRVNQLYNDDLAIRMLLINDTDKLNFDTAAKATEAGGPCGDAPCFTTTQLASCTGALLNRNRIVLGQVVGAGNYDVGHIALGTPGGGVAGLGVIGGTGKARGCTGLPQPEGDFFAIDYVAHEIGHQFGGPHTFNGTEYNCGSNIGGSPWEPGSGSSIMAYAGICQQDNLQPHSDPYFSQRSITDITNTVLAVRPDEDEVQTVSLRGFDTDGESFTLSFDGQTTAPIVRGTEYTTAAIDAALEAIVGTDTVTVAAFGGSGAINDTGFQVTFNGGAVNDVDVESLVLTPVSGDVTGFVGETAQGGPVENGGQTVTPSGNRTPIATAPADKTIPLRTPFALTGSATDPDGDALIHIWEQNDRGGSTGTALGNQVKTNGPLFRIFGTHAPVTPAGTLQINSPGENIATSDPTRVFPDMGQILSNNTNANAATCPAMPAKPATGGATNVSVPVVECFAEWLPTADYVGASQAGNTEPSLNFRFTARDLNPAGGGYAYDDVKLTLDKAAGPFLVSSKNTAGAAAVSGRGENLTWAVAGTNTPALAENVRITLSTDGGQTFDHVLAESTLNDGSHRITWPNVPTTKARIKIEAVDNYFFDVNDADFEINASLTVTGPTQDAVSVRTGDSVPAVELSAATRGGAGEELTATASGLPSGVSLDRVAVSDVNTRPGTATWRLTGTVTAAPGSYPVSVSVSDGRDTVTEELTITVTPAAQTPGTPGTSKAPETTITSGPSEGSIVMDRKQTLEYSSDVAGSTFVCTVDGDPVDCAAGDLTKRFSSGTHQVTVAAVGPDGSADATPATRSFTVPLNDAQLTRKGTWKRVKNKHAFGGGFLVSNDKNAKLVTRVRNATSISLVVAPTPKAGTVKVFLGGKKVRTFNLKGANAFNELRTITFKKARTGNVKIVVGKRKPIRIEGLAVGTDVS
ncbi:reprolysin-like metallopeptidase [Nocardioides sp. 616]|uniref:reprolysin-like metallopeptidase n=1 Tax=Nocardioides sp. 616 TaxID=2268090 RepID=UPI000CE3A2F7|nr:M12 family metallo-peptidase [Nocardioides sp. 616]